MDGVPAGAAVPDRHLQRVAGDGHLGVQRLEGAVILHALVAAIHIDRRGRGVVAVRGLRRRGRLGQRRFGAGEGQLLVSVPGAVGLAGHELHRSAQTALGQREHIAEFAVGHGLAHIIGRLGVGSRQADEHAVVVGAVADEHGLQQVALLRGGNAHHIELRDRVLGQRGHLGGIVGAQHVLAEVEPLAPGVAGHQRDVHAGHQLLGLHGQAIEALSAGGLLHDHRGGGRVGQLADIHAVVVCVVGQHRHLVGTVRLLHHVDRLGLEHRRGGRFGGRGRGLASLLDVRREGQLVLILGIPFAVGLAGHEVGGGSQQRLVQLKGEVIAAGGVGRALDVVGIVGFVVLGAEIDLVVGSFGSGERHVDLAVHHLGGLGRDLEHGVAALHVDGVVAVLAARGRFGGRGSGLHLRQGLGQGDMVRLLRPRSLGAAAAHKLDGLAQLLLLHLEGEVIAFLAVVHALDDAIRRSLVHRRGAQIQLGVTGLLLRARRLRHDGHHDLAVHHFDARRRDVQHLKIARHTRVRRVVAVLARGGFRSRGRGRGLHLRQGLGQGDMVRLLRPRSLGAAAAHKLDGLAQLLLLHLEGEVIAFLAVVHALDDAIRRSLVHRRGAQIQLGVTGLLLRARRLRHDGHHDLAVHHFDARRRDVQHL